MHRNLGIGSWPARRARMTPERIALAFGERRVSYRALHARVTALAHALQARGVGEGDRVAFLGHNHPAALEALFACGVLGAAYVPLQPGADDAALSHALRATRPTVLIATGELAATLERLRGRLELPRCATTAVNGPRGTESYEAWLADGSDEPIDRPIGLHHTCIVASSSGTTGGRKLIPLTHGNLLFNTLDMLSCYDLVRDDVLLLSASLHRTGALGVALTVLFKGGTCVLQPRPGAELSARILRDHGVTVLFDSPPALGALLHEPEFVANVASLRVCVSGGAYVSPRLVQAYARHGLCLQPGYGLTEAAPLVLSVDRDEVRERPGASGRPALYTAVRVVDEELEDVPYGHLGELLVHGPNVTPGYLDDGTARAQTFAEDGWLRTGDAARAASDGMIHVLGRIADAIVVEGTRVMPEPIEDAVCALSGVREAALVQSARERVPVLWLVPTEPTAAAADIERAHAMCRAQLRVPRLLLRLASTLPKNANGKLVRAELRLVAEGV